MNSLFIFNQKNFQLFSIYCSLDCNDLFIFVLMLYKVITSFVQSSNLPSNNENKSLGKGEHLTWRVEVGIGMIKQNKWQKSRKDRLQYIRPLAIYSRLKCIWKYCFFSERSFFEFELYTDKVLCESVRMDLSSKRMENQNR